MFYSLTYTLVCLGHKQIYDMTRYVVVVFPEIWLFIFSLEGPECLSKVSVLGFWETYPCGMSVTFHSPQASLGNFHIMAFVDRLLGLTVNMFEKLSSWWKKKLKREPPYIWNSMLNCKYILRMQRPSLLIKLHALWWQPEKVESLKINVILSLQRSYGTLPLNPIYLLKIEFVFNAQ